MPEETPVAKLSETPIPAASNELAASIDAALAAEFPAVSDADPTPEELAATPPEDEPAAPPAPEAAAVPPEPAKPEAEPPKPEDPISRGMEVLAKKEKEVRQQVEDVKGVRIENQQLRAKIESTDREALEDPAGFFEARGLQGADLAFVAAQLYVKAMGDKAPQSMRDEIKARTDGMMAKREVAALKAREAQREAEARENAARHQAVTYLTSVAGAIPDSLPFLRAEAAEDKVFVANAMYNRVAQLIRQGELDPRIHTDEEMAAMAADSLNKQLKQLAERHEKLYGPLLRKSAAAPPAAPPPKTPTPEAEKKPTAAPKTLNRNNATPIKTPKKSPASDDELIAELAGELSSGKHLHHGLG